MFSRSSAVAARSLRRLTRGPTPRSTPHLRLQLSTKRFEAFDAHLDKEALAETRAWFAQFQESQLPKGNTTFARSSGAGGQHVNKSVPT